MLTRRTLFGTIIGALLAKPLAALGVKRNRMLTVDLGPEEFYSIPNVVYFFHVTYRVGEPPEVIEITMGPEV